MICEIHRSLLNFFLLRKRFIWSNKPIMLDLFCIQVPYSCTAAARLWSHFSGSYLSIMDCVPWYTNWIYIRPDTSWFYYNTNTNTITNTKLLQINKFLAIESKTLLKVGWISPIYLLSPDQGGAYSRSKVQHHWGSDSRRMDWGIGHYTAMRFLEKLWPWS